MAVPESEDEAFDQQETPASDSPIQKPNFADESSSELTMIDLEAAYLRALEAMDPEEWSDESELDDELDGDEFAQDSDVTNGTPNVVSPDTAPVHLPVNFLDEPSVHVDWETGASSAEDVAEPFVSVASPHVLPEVEPFPDSRPSLREWHQSASTDANIEIANADFLGGPSGGSPVAHPLLFPSQSVDSSNSVRPFSHSAPSPIPQDQEHISGVVPNSPAPNATRIIEACLFVGGQPLSAKRLANLLESTAESTFVEQLVDELNLEYASQQRPYEIRLGDGGYRITLRTEFEGVRNRVYGLGPREVKLSQDVLEILALVAYQQPISHAAVEACGKVNAATILRQLLRRELITLVRIDQTRNGVEYRTSPRFLQVFGLGNLNELPRPEDLAMR